MISRFKAWCIPWFAVLSMVIGTTDVHAQTTYTVVVSSSSMTPSPVNLVPGDSVTFEIHSSAWHRLRMDGEVMFGGVALLNHDTATQLFSSEGTFLITDDNSSGTCTIVVKQPQNAAPTVAMLNLTNHTAIMVTNSFTNITLRADAQDEDGSVRRVQFYFGSYTNSFVVTNLIGSVTNSGSSNTTYSYTWTNVPPGHYQVQARAYDNLEVYANTLKLNLSLYTPFTNTLPYITNSTSVAFRFNTDTGLVYVIEVSTNLTNWDSISTNTATNSFIEVVDPNLTTLTQRMYRIRLLP